MSIMYNGALVAGTPEVSTSVQAGDTRPVTSGAVNTALAGKQTKVTASGILIGDGAGGVTAKTLDTSSLTNDNNHIPSSSVVKSAITHDLANIVATGTTNTTGATITAGTYFYLNGTLVRAKAKIAVNATFTSGTNYEAVTAGGLNSLISKLNRARTVGYKSANSTLTLNRFDLGDILLVYLDTQDSISMYTVNGNSSLLPIILGSKTVSLTWNGNTPTITFNSGAYYVFLCFSELNA